MPEIELCCSVCLYVRPRLGLSEDDLAETKRLTVINGHMVCVRHAGAAGPGPHVYAIRAGIHIESGEENMTLEEYQGWRHDQEPPDA